MTVNREVDRAWNSCRFQFPGSEVITSIVLSFIDRDIMKPGNSSDSIKSFGARSLISSRPTNSGGGLPARGAYGLPGGSTGWSEEILNKLKATTNQVPPFTPNRGNDQQGSY